MDKFLRDLIHEIFPTCDNLKTDSRSIEPGDIFIAINGTVLDGHDYVAEALQKGARLALCERAPRGVDTEKIIVVPDTCEVLARLAKFVFADPSEHLSTYGVTGTNGKTSTVFFIDSMLEAGGRGSGFISTIFSKKSPGLFIRSVMTTPDVITINRFLAELVKEEKEAAVIEISSHALNQRRIEGIRLDSAVFTNITPEHLDYHVDMKSYLEAKARIFEYLKPQGVGVLNSDDPMVIGSKKLFPNKSFLTFGIKNDANVSAKNVELSISGVIFDLMIEGKKTVKIKSPVVGMHSVYNLLAAVAALLRSGIKISAVKEGLENTANPPGRLEKVKSNAPFNVFVDYAHTPDALENLLGALRLMAKGKLICVFGCGGDRDRTKRPVMGKIAASLADKVIITSDNPRTEDPLSILKEIEAGVSNKERCVSIEDRRDAINEALNTAGGNDIVVIAGKGHETRQIIGSEPRHFDDKEAAVDILKEMGYR